MNKSSGPKRLIYDQSISITIGKLRWSNMPEGKAQQERCTSKSEGTGGLIPILQQYEGKLFPVQMQVCFRAHADTDTHTHSHRFELNTEPVYDALDHTATI